MSPKPRIAIPEPTSFDPAYNQRGWPQYAHAVECSGGVAVPVPLTESLASVEHILSGCSAVLLPGSPADLDARRFGQERDPHSAAPDPVREAVDDLLLRDAAARNKPVFGICYGLQSLNVWRHGALHQHISGTGVDHAPGRTVNQAHAVVIEPSSRLGAILGEYALGPLAVNSSHHQAVASPGDGLRVVARSVEDGIVEAAEDASTDRFELGVQWHPERTFGVDAASRALFAAFVAAAQAWRPREVAGAVGTEATGR